MIPVTIEGVRRNFTISAAFMYSVTLIDESGQRIFVFGVERHEAMAIVVALHDLTHPHPQTVNLMVDTLKQFGHTLEEVRIESFSTTFPLYHLCSCVLRWSNGGNGEAVQEQMLHARPGDILALALHMKAPIFVSDEFAKKMGASLAEGETPEILFAKYLLKQERLTLPEGKKLRLGFGKTPLRDALVKEFKAALQGKEPPFPEEDMEQRKQAYLSFLLGEEVRTG